MNDLDARTSEIRDLEAKLEQYLLVLDHAEARGIEVFKTAAIVASLQRRLDRLHGTEIAVDQTRRDAFLTHLVKTMMVASPDPDASDQGRHQ